MRMVAKFPKDLDIFLPSILQSSRILGLANHHPQFCQFFTIQKQTITPIVAIIAAEIRGAEIHEQIEARSQAPSSLRLAIGR